MKNPFPGSTELKPRPFLESQGSIFAEYGIRTQDSGNVSYGVSMGRRRFFVKTAGIRGDPKPYLGFEARIALLRNAACLAGECAHPLLAELHQVVESSEGPMLVYEWVEGELLGVPRDRRSDPASAFQRFKGLPVRRLIELLGRVIDLHARLEGLDRVVGDFYDGCLIYDFSHDALKVVDLDMYRKGSYRNEMGRMFGSERFMAPEEFELGALIDHRTTVFAMGRLADVFLGNGEIEEAEFRGGPALFEVVKKACQPDPTRRFGSVSDLHREWESTIED